MAYPRTVVLEGMQLTEIRDRLLSGNDPTLQTALVHLTAQADKWLDLGPWSVVTKMKPPPSGDMHDYTSQAPYCWPSSTPDGNTYVNRDGEKNPEVYDYTDRQGWGSVFNASYNLSLAWFYTSNEAYARHVGDILRTWFISPATRMNPNLNHAQVIPHANTGRCIGIIDFSQAYTSVLDAAAILTGGSSSGGPAPGWTADDITGFHDWNVAFLSWLKNSPFGQQESEQKNNHGTFAAMQKAAIALLVRERIDASIQPDGSQPEELRRTRSWHYSTFNLLALTRMAAIAEKVGVDLWSHRNPQGQSIMKAIEYLIPATTGSAPWPFPELGFQAFAAADIVRAAAAAGNEMAKQAFGTLQEPPDGDTWLLRPAPEQLDAVEGAKP